MKKIVALLLAMLMIATFVACDASKSKNDDGDSNEKVELSRGSIDGAVYTNDYLGFTFTRPDSWVYSTDEEIAAAMNVGVEFLGDKFKDALENNPAVYDMMVVDSITRSNINVGYENLSKTLSTNITEEQYLDAVKQQLASISSMQVSFPDEYETVKLGENEYTKGVCTTKVNGVSMTQVYYLRKMDGYMGFIIVTITNTANKTYTVSEIEEMFS